MQAATFLVDANIVRGNTLSGYLVDEDGAEASQELIKFSWWHRVDGKPGMVQREPFTLESLRSGAGRNDLFDFRPRLREPVLAVPDRPGPRRGEAR